MEDNVDKGLLERFEQDIWSKIPHLESGKVVNPTPLKDITKDLIECAKSVYNINLSDSELRVFGKYDSSLLTGSIKIRPAVHIVHEAIITGKLKSGQTVIEATSGNFGIALGLLSNLGLTVVTLVSRRLQEGVFKELRNENIRIMDLDMDICPAPGMKDNPNVLAAKATAANVRSQMSQMGFNPEIFDKEIAEIESLLAKQDIINLAKFLSKIYDCFCPQQYDNKLNIEVHKTVTAAEIDQQLSETGNSLKDFEVVCTFGTGGTSGGISRYVSEKYSKKSVHIVFPSAGQDVAGIRTKANADGLTYYTPEIYAGQHEVDFEQAKPLLKYFIGKGHDIGESSALALYAIMQMANFGGGGRFVAIIADGIAKYKKNFETMSKQKRTRVSLEEATASTGEYDKVFWIHTQYTPKEEGLEVIAKSLGIDKSKIIVPKARTINEMLSTQKIPEELKKALEGSGKSLLVCMAGNTSLMAANVLGANGISAESLNGGITELPDAKTKPIPDLIQIARE